MRLAHLHLRLFLHSPNGDQGFPGALSVCATYTLDRHSKLSLTYRAVSDAPTVVDLTNHAYWNLDAEGSVNVLAHHLQVDEPLHTPVEDTHVHSMTLSRRPPDVHPRTCRHPSGHTHHPARSPSRRSPGLRRLRHGLLHGIQPRIG
ncbi:hypothetical protein AB0D46_21435 [Streptomyces sp. NPDC048383]|uniref:aldose epimerase family protein n=1 Tax=Streptomyces sp. NPDC048383 TaxID=3155386 RepID=UPI00341C0F58